jgi:hypothetical protein
VLLQALDLASDGVIGHLSGFCKRTAVGDATRQSGHDSGESAFWLGTNLSGADLRGTLLCRVSEGYRPPLRAALCRFAPTSFSPMCPPKSVDDRTARCFDQKFFSLLHRVFILLPLI